MTPTRLTHFAGGARVGAQTSRSAPVYDPASGRHVADVPLADAADIERVIADAHVAAPAWGARSALDRARVLFTFRELCLAHAAELSALISGEHGKVFADARGELQRGLGVGG